MTDKIDWKNAPEGATHYQKTSVKIYWYKLYGGRFYPAEGLNWNISPMSVGFECKVDMRPIPHAHSIDCDVVPTGATHITPHKTFVRKENNGKWSQFWGGDWVMVFFTKNDISSFKPIRRNIPTSTAIPELKKLTQAVFDGLPVEYQWAAVDRDGCVLGYENKPDCGHFTWAGRIGNPVDIGSGYDATDWQNSLIKRRESITDVARSIEAARVAEPERKHSHYFKDVSGIAQIDVYSVLRLFEVTDPCLQHIVKKALCAGKRGAKDFARDVQEIADTAARLIELESGK